MDYNHKNAYFEAIFLILNIDRLKNEKNFFNKSAYALQLLLELFVQNPSMKKFLLLILNVFVTEF